MRIINDLNQIDSRPKPLAVALGNFDGVHLGHKQLLTGLKGFADKVNVEPAIVTFYPHPLNVLQPEKRPRLILSLEDKLAKIDELGIKTVILMPFNETLAAMAADDFIIELLINRLHAVGIFVGYNYTFGQGGKGTPETLHKYSQECNYTLSVTPPVEVAGQLVSSSLIREKVSAGLVQDARLLLGYLPFIKGRVVHGEKRGRTIGFPTANLQLSDEFLHPAPGVYAVVINLAGKDYRGVANIGVKPTFHLHNTVINLEVHIFDFTGKIYDEEIKVEFVQRIRGERHFHSLQELIDQIKGDVDMAKQLLDKFFHEANFKHNLQVS